MSWLRNVVGCTAGIGSMGFSADYLYSKHLENKAIKSMKIYKLGIASITNPEGREISFYAPYGIVKEGKPTLVESRVAQIILLTNNNENKKIKEMPIKEEFEKSLFDYFAWSVTRSVYCRFLSIDEIEEPLHRARNEWEVEERQSGELGHVAHLVLSPLNPEDETKVNYYTEIALLALGNKFSMPTVYSGPNPFEDRVNPNGIAIDQNKKGCSLITPLGRFNGRRCDNLGVSATLFLEVEGELSTPTCLKSVLIGPSGQSFPAAEYISHEKLQYTPRNYPSYEECNNEWERLRDYIFKQVNEHIKASPTNSE